MEIIKKILKGDRNSIDTLLEDLVNGGEEFYCFYGDIEAALMDNDSEYLEINLEGTKESYDNLYKYYNLDGLSIE